MLEGLPAHASDVDDVDLPNPLHEPTRIPGLLKIPAEIQLKIVRQLLPTKCVFDFYPEFLPYQWSNVTGTMVRKLRHPRNESVGTAEACTNGLKILNYALTCSHMKELCYIVIHGENHFVLEIATLPRKRSYDIGACRSDRDDNDDLLDGLNSFNYSPDLIWPFCTGFPSYLTEVTILITIHPGVLITQNPSELTQRFGEAIRIFSRSKKLRKLIIDVRRTTSRWQYLGHPPARMIWNDTGLPQEMPTMELRALEFVDAGLPVFQDFLKHIGDLAAVEWLVVSARDEGADASDLEPHSSTLRALLPPNARA